MFLLFAVVAVAILLLLGDGLFMQEGERATMPSKDTAEYVKKQEEKLQVLLCRMDGVGSCEVMLTAGEGNEYVYAQDITRNSYGESMSYITVSGNDGDGVVTITVRPPKITGAVVVCQGGGSMHVRNEITELICKMYGLSAAEVHVAKSK